MAEFDNTPYLGPFRTEPSAAELQIIADYDKGLGNANREIGAQNPPSFMDVLMQKSETLAVGVPGSPVDFVVPFPLKLLRFDGAAETFGVGLTALTYDVQVNRAGAGFVTVLDAPTDVFLGGAGVVTSSAPEVGLEDIDFGDIVRVIWLATGGAAVHEGATLRVHAKHR